jgi:hypothetical protein
MFQKQIKEITPPVLKMAIIIGLTLISHGIFEVFNSESGAMIMSMDNCNASTLPYAELIFGIMTITTGLILLKCGSYGDYLGFSFFSAYCVITLVFAI